MEDRVSFARFVVLAFACWRATNLLAGGNEDGPFNILHKIRHLAGVRYDDYNTPYGDTELGKVFACPWCMSVWVGVVVALFAYLFPKLTFWVFGVPLGLSGATMLLHKQIRG